MLFDYYNFILTEYNRIQHNNNNNLKLKKMNLIESYSWSQILFRYCVGKYVQRDCALAMHWPSIRVFIYVLRSDPRDQTPVSLVPSLAPADQTHQTFLHLLIGPVSPPHSHAPCIPLQRGNRSLLPNYALRILTIFSLVIRVNRWRYTRTCLLRL